MEWGGGGPVIQSSHGPGRKTIVVGSAESGDRGCKNKFECGIRFGIAQIRSTQKSTYGIPLNRCNDCETTDKNIEQHKVLQDCAKYKIYVNICTGFVNTCTGSDGCGPDPYNPTPSWMRKRRTVPSADPEARVRPSREMVRAVTCRVCPVAMVGSAVPAEGHRILKQDTKVRGRGALP